MPDQILCTRKAFFPFSFGKYDILTASQFVWGRSPPLVHFGVHLHGRPAIRFNSEVFNFYCLRMQVELLSRAPKAGRFGGSFVTFKFEIFIFLHGLMSVVQLRIGFS